MADSVKAVQERIYAIARTQERHLQEAISQCLQNVKSLATLKVIETALLNNDRYAIDRLYAEQDVRQAFLPLENALGTAYAIAGYKLSEDAKLLQHNANVPVAVYFNQMNPLLTGLVQNYSNTLITSMSQTAKSALGQMIGEQVLQGISPIETARSIRASIGMTPQQVKAYNNYEKLLRQGSKKALAYESRDKRYDASLGKMSEDKIRKALEAFERKAIKRRSETMARTESLRLTNMANQHMYDDALLKGRIVEGDYKRFWLNAKDLKVRHSHVEIPHMNKDGVRLQEPFKSPLGLIMYPHDPSARGANTINCRCTVLYKMDIKAIKERLGMK